MIRTPDQRVRVFISSTMKELATERQAVAGAISQLRLTPVLFELGARPYAPRDLYRAYLEQSDIFIGIYAGSYGWIAPGMEISGLEDEYRLSAGKPRLIYTKTTSQREPRLSRFLDSVRAEGVVSYHAFATADELGHLVADDLALLLTERFTSAPSAPAPAPLPIMRHRPLIGRVEQLAALTESLLQPEAGVVTLIGPGGVGKTTLAIAAAHAVTGQFADGAAFVSLENLTDSDLVRETVARQLRVATRPGQTLEESLLAFLEPLRLLLVVDNVEQFQSVAPLLKQILQRAPGLRVLATSRGPLGLRGEKVVVVAPLAVPKCNVAVDPETLAAVPAVAYFVACGRDAQPDFELTEGNAGAVAEICRRLEGLPLALQLAAARLTVLSPAALVERLDRSLPLLTHGARDLPARQQTLRAAIGWSYDLLGTAEQRVFRHLGVFVGGFTLEAVEGLLAASSDDLDPLEAISSLVGQSLIFVQPLDVSPPWYGMLETIREFALEQLDQCGEATLAHRRRAELIQNVTERAEPKLLVPAERRNWMERLERTHDNVRAALTWSMSADGVQALGVDVAGALGWFWLMSGRLEEAARWYSALLARRGEADNSLAWAKVLHGYALQCWGRGDVQQATRLEESAVPIFRSAGDSRWLTYALTLLARARTGQQRLAEARALLEEAASVWSHTETTYGQPFGAYLRYYLGNAALAEGDVDTARTDFETSLRQLDAAGDEMGRAVVLGGVGLLDARQGDHTAARAVFAESLPPLRANHDQWDLALLLLNAGLEEAEATSPVAKSLLIEAIHVWQRLGVKAGMVLPLAGLGEVAAGGGAARRAGQLFGASQTLLAEGDPLLRVVVPYDLSARLAATRARGDSEAFDRGLVEGQGWDIDTAVAAGLAMRADDGEETT